MLIPPAVLRFLRARFAGRTHLVGAHPIGSPVKSLGYVGGKAPDTINPAAIQQLREGGYIPVVPIPEKDLTDYLLTRDYDVPTMLEALSKLGLISFLIADTTVKGPVPLDFLVNPKDLAPHPDLLVGKHKLIAIHDCVMESRLGGQLDQQRFTALHEYARTKLKGKQRALVEALIEAGGAMAIPDLAVKSGIDWDHPDTGFKDTSRPTNQKLYGAGWKIVRYDSEARLVRLPDWETTQQP